MRQARRMLGPRWSAMGRDGQAWQDFITGIHGFQLTDDLASVEFLSDALHKYSQGLPGIAILVYRYAQRYALLSGVSMVSEGIMKAVSEDLFAVIQPMLNALESGDKGELGLYEDLSFVDELLDDETIRSLVEERKMLTDKLKRAAVSAGVRGVKMIKDQVARDALNIVGIARLDPKVLETIKKTKEGAESHSGEIQKSVRKMSDIS